MIIQYAKLIIYNYYVQGTYTFNSEAPNQDKIQGGLYISSLSAFVDYVYHYTTISPQKMTEMIKPALYLLLMGVSLLS